MKASRRILGSALAAIALLALPAGAAAKQGPEIQERSLRLSLVTKGSNGYRAILTTAGHRQVKLELIDGSVAVALQTTGRVSRRGIEATFGDLGRVSVRFDAARREARDRSGRDCRGRGPIFEEGVFRGTIRFEGENGFTRIDASQAGGVVERRFRRVCEPSPPTAAAFEDAFQEAFEEIFNRVRLTYLRASTRVAGTNVIFEAASFDFRPIFGPRTPLEYAATARSVQRREGMLVSRSVIAEGGEATLLASKRGKVPATATVAPPKPFTRTAQYVKEPGSAATWVGPLAVRLPGASLVPLTGPGFKSVLCHLSFGALLEGGCALGSGKPDSRSLAGWAAASAQGSGSHSQAFADARLSWSR